MLNVIKELLLKIVSEIDAGNTDMTEKDSIEVIDTLKRLLYNKTRLSKYSACQYLNISRATFDNLVRAGKLPKGKHDIGFKELSWSKEDLNNFIKNTRRGGVEK